MAARPRAYFRYPFNSAYPPGRHALGLRVLGVLDKELGEYPFIAGDAYTIADMSLFAYVHCADEADFPLREYRNVVRSIGQVRSQDGLLDKTYPYSIDPQSTRDLPRRKRDFFQPTQRRAGTDSKMTRSERSSIITANMRRSPRPAAVRHGRCPDACSNTPSDVR